MNQYLARKATRFFFIVGGGIIVALLIWLATNVFDVALPGVDTSPLNIRVIAAPAAYDWIAEAAERFNAERKRLGRRPIVVEVVEQDVSSLQAQVASVQLTPAPAAWIAEGGFAVDVVNLAARQADGRDAFASEGPVAQSVLMWGGFADRVAALDTRYGGLNWSALHEAALAPNGWAGLGGRTEWGFFKLVLPDPRKSSEGLAAILSAAAEYHNKTSLTAADINDARFQQWARTLINAVPNFANLGAEPGGALAVRGPSAGDAGLLLEASWLSAASGLNNWQPVALRYAPATVTFDFPFCVWIKTDATIDPTVRDARRQAALLFRDYLLDGAQQRRAEARGLRPASGNASNDGDSLFGQWASLGLQAGRPPTTGVSVDAEAVLAALRWVEIVVNR